MKGLESGLDYTEQAILLKIRKIQLDSFNWRNQGLYLPTILKNVLSLFFRVFYIKKHLSVTQLLVGLTMV